MAQTIFFVAIGNPVPEVVLGGADVDLFTLSQTGTLTFNDAPNFERPRDKPLADDNTNTYTLSITATSSIGLVSETITIVVSNENEPPSKPIFTVGTITSTSVDINWQRPTNTGTPINGYYIIYKVVGTTIPTIENVNSDSRTHTIEGLTPATRYEIALVANSSEGVGRSDTIEIITSANTPPTAVTINGITEVTNPC